MDENQKPERRDRFLPLSIIVAAVLIAGAVIYSAGRGELTKETADLADSAGGLTDLIDDDVILGDPKAPITVVEFGDYQCPFCGKFFSQTEPQLREDYVKTGKAKFVYRDFAFLGPESQMAALASQCAAEQGKFWEYHDKLFETEIADGRENNGNLSSIFLKSLAGRLGLNQQQFDKCLDSQKYLAEIEKDYEDGRINGVGGTPTTFVNGQSVSGAQPYSVFKAAIDKELAK